MFCPPSNRSPSELPSRVTDHRGRVHGYDGLYVLDGSIVPTALGVNPSLTISALSLRVADKILEEWPAK